MSYKKLVHAHVYLPRSGSRAPKIAMLKYYYNVLKWKNKFTSEFKNAKITDYIKKWFIPKLILSVFFAAVSPDVNLFFRFNTLQYFKLGNLWSPIALLREVDMCTHWVFCRKFNIQQILFEAFFDIINIFGSAEPENESTLFFQYIIRFQRGNLRSTIFFEGNLKL